MQGIVDDHLVGAELGGDVGGGTQPVIVLFLEPAGVDRERDAAVGERDSVLFGEPGDDVPADAGGFGEFVQAAPVVDVLALKEVPGE